MIKRELYSRKRSKVYSAFIDYKIAFHTVDRDKVWETLHNLETPSKAVKNDQSYLLLCSVLCSVGS